VRLDHPRLGRQPPAVRVQAEHGNDCWQFDMSPPGLKRIGKPDWTDPDKGEPTLTLFSVVDDYSGTPYLEYYCVYGEDAESRYVSCSMPRRRYQKYYLDRVLGES
jgi:hypothetical protein